MASVEPRIATVDVEIPLDVLTQATEWASYGAENKPEQAGAAFRELDKLLLRWPGLVSRHALAVPNDPKSWTTLLYTSARAGNVATGRLLIRRGADPNMKVKNDSKSTPMHVACFRGHVDCVKAMLNSKYTFDRTAKNHFGETCDAVFRKEVSQEDRAKIKDMLNNPPPFNPRHMEAVAPLEHWFYCVETSIGEINEFKPLSIEEVHSLQFALNRKETTWRDKDGETHQISLWEPDADCISSQVEISDDLLRYKCRLFYQTDESQWFPVSHTDHEKIMQAMQATQHVPDVIIARRKYCLTTWQCENLETERSRPLLYIRDDGSAVCGRCRSIWLYGEKGLNVVQPLPFASIEHLETAIANSGVGGRMRADSADIPLSADRFAEAALQVDLKSSVPGVYAARSLTGNGKEYRITKVVPTAFVLSEEGQYYDALPPQAALVLQLASSANHTSVRYENCEYDFVLCEARNITSGDSRPLLLVNPPPESTTEPASLLSGGSNKEICDRLRLATAKRDEADLRKILSSAPNGSEATLEQCLALVNVLLRDHGITVKGGVVRDAIVMGSVAQMKDFDLELPNTVSYANWRTYIDKLITSLVHRGCILMTDMGSETTPPELAGQSEKAEVPYPKCLSVRLSKDLLSDAGIPMGMIVVQLVSPPVTLEMVPPWNLYYHPPRNVDFSVNNLRLVPPTQDEATYKIYQNVPLGLDVEHIIGQIRSKETYPIYDVEWIPGEGPRSGDGTNRNLQCVPRKDIPKSRQTVMEKRLESMRKKGYRFVERK